MWMVTISTCSEQAWGLVVGAHDVTPSVGVRPRLSHPVMLSNEKRVSEAYFYKKNDIHLYIEEFI
jgi:hypothetical protein